MWMWYIIQYIKKEITMSSMGELQKQVDDLIKEVEDLKARIKALEEK